MSLPEQKSDEEVREALVRFMVSRLGWSEEESRKIAQPMNRSEMHEFRKRC